MPGQISRSGSRVFPIGAFSFFGGKDFVRTRQGYHVIKVLDRKKEWLFAIEEVKPGLANYLKIQKSREELNNLVNRLRQKAKIEILISAGDLPNP